MWFMCGWQVKLCDPFVTFGPYLNALETGQKKPYINSRSLVFTSTFLFSRYVFDMYYVPCC